MTDDSTSSAVPRWLNAAGIVTAIAGLADSSYLTSKHFAGSAVPCNLLSGCETVLTSSYAEFLGIPTALFGAVAYFAAFSLALLVFFGHEKLWNLFGAVTAAMFLASVFFVYLQAFVIEAFCQYCLLSAATSTILFAIFLVSFRLRKK